jgi:hypothetical protein
MRRIHFGAYLLSPAAVLFAQTVPPDRFKENVEVTVRSVVAVVTDAQGKHLLSPPTAADLDVFEGGSPAPVVEIEPLRGPFGSPSPAAVAALPGTTVPASVSSPAVGPVTQILYVDPQFVYRGSANLYLQALTQNVEPLLARGSLRIVVAGDPPKELAPSTMDSSLVRAALSKIPREASGVDSVFEARRQLMDQPKVGDWQMIARFAIARDIQRIEASLDRLEMWAAQDPPTRPTVLYLVNDGFELDPTDFYLTCKYICPPSAVLERERFRNEFSRRVPQMLERVSADLVSLGFVVVPVTNGTPPIYRFGGTAEIRGLGMDKSLASAVRPIPGAPASLAWQPTDPLNVIADSTGGEVVVGAGKLRRLLDRFDDAYIVSYQSRSGTDSKARSLEVHGKRPGLIVRAARTTAGGSVVNAILAHGRAVEALRRPDAEGRLSVTVRVEEAGKEKGGKLAGRLLVTTDLAEAIATLSRKAGTRARVTIAVETDDPVPFVQSEEVEPDASGEATMWTYEAPMIWPKSARRVSVLVEELHSGLFGSAMTELPR